MNQDAKEELLKMTLSMAVPLWIDRFKTLTHDELVAIAKEAGQTVAEKGDIILFRSGKEGETANAFNQLARGIAALAFAPGGVTMFGLHFEVA